MGSKEATVNYWTAFGNGFIRLVEMVFDKIRWNVMGIALIIAWIIIDFGDKLIGLLEAKAVDPQLIITVIVGLISVGVGGLITAMVRMFESPSVPAETHERLTKDLVRQRVDKYKEPAVE